MTTYELIKEAIVALKDRAGSSPQAIKKWWSVNGKKEVAPHVIKKALKTGVEREALVKVKGSYKLSTKIGKASKEKLVAKKKVATKKKVVKKDKIVAKNKNSTRKKSASQKSTSTSTRKAKTPEQKEALKAKTSKAIKKSVSEKKGKVVSESEYITNMEDYVCNAIPLKEMLQKGEINYHNVLELNGISPNPAKRMKKLNADLQTFQNGFLPLHSNGTGIYICHDEDDPAYMKCLMTGPEGTPYSWGLFEFDIYIPGDYPLKPPKLTYCTTNNGTIRFNPNLYNSGYVCLSLLGTWSGPSWDPRVGSLVQILNSIQALVLVEDPYFNEPGTDRTRDKARARQYLHKVREATLRYAITKQLSKPGPIWKSVVSDHFKLTKGHIYEMAAKWIEEAPVVAAFCPFSVGCQGIRSTMQEAYREMEIAFKSLKK